MLVVDDGSGAAYRRVVDETARAGAVVILRDRNRGTGRALKTGVAYAAGLWPGEQIVCADSDVPMRSRAGNGITRRLFFLTTGTDVSDTQTGLRAYPPGLLPGRITDSGRRGRLRRTVRRARAHGQSARRRRRPRRAIPAAGWRP